MDDWEDNDFQNKWGGSVTTAADDYATTQSVVIAAEGSDLPGGTPNRSIRMYGSIDFEDGSINKYPYSQMIIGLGGTRSMLNTFSHFVGVRFSYKWAGPTGAGRTFYISLPTPQTVTDFATYRHVLLPPVNNNWNTVSAYFPNMAPAAPRFAQPPWANPFRAWVTTPFSGDYVVSIDFAIVPPASPSPAYDYDLMIDDVTFF